MMLANRPKVLFAAGLISAGCWLAGCNVGPTPIDVVEATISDVQEAILSGRTTCRMVVQAHLDRIAAYDSLVNAITVLSLNALAEADRIDEAVRTKTELGSLFCVPMLVKDNFDTHDMVTTGGSSALARSIPPDDAFMVRRIREAGAIVLAKTNMAEWAFSPRETVSSSFGATRNAYALDRVPAGSSGGTASAIAASFGLIGLGTDTGNSIRGPASHLALVGIRSTIGLTSRDGVIPLFFDRDVAGPMGRTVEDVARVFNIIVGYDPADPYTEHGRHRREDDYVAFLDPDGLEGARIGVLRSLVEVEEADTAVVRVFENALADLTRLGAKLVEPFPFDVHSHLGQDWLVCRRFRYDMGVYLKSLGTGAPMHDVMEVLETGQYGPKAEDPLRRFGSGPLNVHPANEDPACPDYFEHEGRQAYLRALVAAMDSFAVDAIVYPSWLTPPAHIDRATEEYAGDNSQLVAPATGMPAITVPMGYTYTVLPAGLQILARPYDEGLLFRLAFAYEQGTRHRRPPPLFPSLK